MNRRPIRLGSMISEGAERRPSQLCVRDSQWTGWLYPSVMSNSEAQWTPDQQPVNQWIATEDNRDDRSPEDPYWYRITGIGERGLSRVSRSRHSSLPPERFLEDIRRLTKDHGNVALFCSGESCRTVLLAKSEEIFATRTRKTFCDPCWESTQEHEAGSAGDSQDSPGSKV